MGHDIVAADQSERSSLDSSAFVFDGKRLTDLQLDQPAVEILRRRGKAYVPAWIGRKDHEEP